MSRDNLRIIDNPAFAGMQPQMLGQACHDGSPFLQIRCSCGADSHLNESQIAGAPKRARLGVRCAGCREHLMINIKEVRGAFAQMRKDGWIA